MTLRELLAQLPPDLLLPELAPSGDHPALEQAVTGLCTNSKICQPGELFIGMPGTRVTLMTESTKPRTSLTSKERGITGSSRKTLLRAPSKYT